MLPGYESIHSRAAHNKHRVTYSLKPFIINCLPDITLTSWAPEYSMEPIRLATYQASLIQNIFKELIVHTPIPNTLGFPSVNTLE